MQMARTVMYFFIMHPLFLLAALMDDDASHGREEDCILMEQISQNGKVQKCRNKKYPMDGAAKEEGHDDRHEQQVTANGSQYDQGKEIKESVIESR